MDLVFLGLLLISFALNMILVVGVLPESRSHISRLQHQVKFLETRNKQSEPEIILADEMADLSEANKVEMLKKQINKSLDRIKDSSNNGLRSWVLDTYNCQEEYLEDVIKELKIRNFKVSEIRERYYPTKYKIEW